MRPLLWLILYAASWALIGAWLSLPPWLLVLLYPLACPVLYYGATPIAARLGMWRYLSSDLIVYRSMPRGPLAIHLGTSYDVLWRLLPLRRPGEGTHRVLHREIYRGLASLCRDVETGRVAPETVITTCSYFLGERRMAELGFREAPVPFWTLLNFVVAYPEVLLQQWLISGRFQFFDPRKIRYFRTTAAELAQSRRRGLPAPAAH